MKRIIAVLVALVMSTSASLSIDVKAASLPTKVKSVALGGMRSAVITKDNRLYVWGNYSYSGDALGNYEFPTLIMKGGQKG